jgi:hypothetical protein
MSGSSFNFSDENENKKVTPGSKFKIPMENQNATYGHTKM